MTSSFGTLEITYPNGRSATVALTRATVSVGRGDENDINLGDDQGISRRHAQFLCTPGQISVVSLSQDGLVVDGVRFGLNGESELRDGSLVVIGPVLIRVIYAAEPPPPRAPTVERKTTEDDKPQPPQIDPPPEPTADLEPPIAPPAPAPSPAPASGAGAAGAHLGLRLSKATIAVVPGARSTISAVVEKRFGEVDAVRIEIDGIPNTWYSVEPPSVNLYPYDSARSGSAQPDSRGTFAVNVHPPKHHSSSEGVYNCTLVARSETRPGEPASQAIVITVEPFYQIQTQLHPAHARGRRGRYRLSVANQSNAALPIRVDAADDEGRLQLDPEHEQFGLAPGEERTLALTARPPWRWPFGPPVTYDLSATVAPALPGIAPARETGRLTVSRLPAWLQVLPLLLLLALALGFVLYLLPDQRPTAAVVEAPLARREAVVAQAVPREVLSLSFARDGVVQRIAVQPDTFVPAGTLLADLRYYEQLLALRKAEDGLERALIDLENARRQQQRDVRMAELGLQQSQVEVARVAPGGPDDPARQQAAAQTAVERELSAAQREAASASALASEAKLSAESELVKAAEALQNAQQRYSKAYWENTWVEERGTDPTLVVESTVTTGDGGESVEETVPVKLNSVQRQAFKDALAAAEREMHAAERAVETARRAFDRAKADEIASNDAAADSVQAVQDRIADLATSAEIPNLQLDAARLNVEMAEIKVETARETGLEPFIKAVEAAQQGVDEARAMLENRTIRAPAAGVVLDVTVPVSSSVTTATPVVLFAVGREFDLAAQLTPEQIAALNTYQRVDVVSTTVPTVTGTATLLRLPAVVAPAGAAPPDQTARFAVDSKLADALKPGASVRMTITLQLRPKATVVPPPFVYADGERRYLLVRELPCAFSPWGKGLLLRLCERRVYVQTGLSNDEQVEIRNTFDATLSAERLVRGEGAAAPTYTLVGP